MRQYGSGRPCRPNKATGVTDGRLFYQAARRPCGGLASGDQAPIWFRLGRCDHPETTAATLRMLARCRGTMQ